MAMGSDNFRAGLFVIIGGVGAFIAIVLLADIGSAFESTRSAKVRFPLINGLRGLKQGASVTIGDHPAGNVVSITDETNADDEPTGRAMIVTFTIPARYKLYDNATIELDVPPLGAGTELNIRSVGYPVNSAEEEPAYLVQGTRVVRTEPATGEPIIPADLARRFSAQDIKAQGKAVTVDPLGRIKVGPTWELVEGEMLRGGVAPSPIVVDLVKEVGIDEVQKAQLREMISNFAAMSNRLSALGEAVAGSKPLDQLPERSQKVAQIVTALNQMTQALGGDVPADRLTDRAQRIDRAAADLTAAIADAKAMLGTGKRLLTDNEKRLTDAIEAARAAMSDAREIAGRMKKSTLEKIDSAFGKAKDALDDLKVTTGEFKTLAVSQRPVLDRMIANMRLSSDQLKLATIEIRRSPWRLLYQPSDKELETDNLYDSARSFSLAAGSLESTAESLRMMLEKFGDKLDPNDANVKLMLDNLHQSFEGYHQAEQKFWDALSEKPGAGD